MAEFFHTRVKAFQFAFEGCKYVIRTQRNAWIHAVATLVVLLLMIWLRLSFQDVAILVLAIAMVWVSEFLNTSLESLVDLASPNFHPLAKISKDVAAGAVLVAAVASVIIGLLIMGPPLLIRLNF